MAAGLMTDARDTSLHFWNPNWVCNSPTIMHGIDPQPRSGSGPVRGSLGQGWKLEMLPKEKMAVNFGWERWWIHREDRVLAMDSHHEGFSS